MIVNLIYNCLTDGQKATLKVWAKKLNYETSHWVRIVMYRECFGFIRELGPENLDVLEVSAGWRWQGEFDFKSFTKTSYPEFDICKDVLPRQFDLIIADQVFEHLLWPHRAAKNVCDMLRPNGWFVVTTPFLIRIHDEYDGNDCTRWTETGLKYFLSEAGFELDDIQTGSWGNRACVRANLNRWARKELWSSLRNEPNFPVAVWAFAKKAA